jgi:hypothetical protein
MREFLAFARHPYTPETGARLMREIRMVLNGLRVIEIHGSVLRWRILRERPRRRGPL